jgi:hypothetical protein
MPDAYYTALIRTKGELQRAIHEFTAHGHDTTSLARALTDVDMWIDQHNQPAAMRQMLAKLNVDIKTRIDRFKATIGGNYGQKT